MRLADAKALAELLIEEHLSNDTKRTWKFRWNNRVSWGRCVYQCKRTGGSYIELSRKQTPYETEDATEQTILHEIAHALTPGAGHGRLWKAMALSVGVRNPKATRGSSNVEGVAHPPKWVMVCGDTTMKPYYRRPSPKTFREIHLYFVPGRKRETLGKAELITYAEFQRRQANANEIDYR